MTYERTNGRKDRQTCSLKWLFRYLVKNILQIFIFLINKEKKLCAKQLDFQIRLQTKRLKFIRCLMYFLKDLGYSGEKCHIV